MKRYRIYTLVTVHYEKRGFILPKNVIKKFYTRDIDPTYLYRRAVDLYGSAFVEIVSIKQLDD